MHQWPFSIFLMLFNLMLLSTATFVLNTVLAPSLGLQPNPEAATVAEKVLFRSLAKIETFWLKGNGRFLLGSNQPSIADLSLVCEIMQLEVCIDRMPAYTMTVLNMWCMYMFQGPYEFM